MSNVVHRVPIGALQPHHAGFFVVGITVAKHQSRALLTSNSRAGGGVSLDGDPPGFAGGKRRDSDEERHVAQMTIRDSPDDVINVTMWMGQDLASDYDENYHIGDVVELVNVRVQLKDHSPSNQRFSPQVSSPFCLVFSEPNSSISKFHPNNVDQYLHLLSIPTKTSLNFFSLSDIQMNPRLNDNDVIDILAAVRSVGMTRKFQSKTGDERHMKEVRLFDQSNEGLILKLWDYEWVQWADKWKPFTDVVFLADVRVNRDEYRNCNIATATSRSIITLNPYTEEARLLMDFVDIVKERGEDYHGFTSDAWMDYSTIQKVANIVSLQEIRNPGDSPQLGVIVYGYFSRMDIDDEVSNLQRLRCSGCRELIRRDNNACSNDKCSVASTDGHVFRQFNIRVSVMDLTGTLDNCRLSEDAINRNLFSMDDLLKSTREERTRLKWRFFLQPLKIWLLLRLSSIGRSQVTVHVLNWAASSYDEFCAKSVMPPVQ